MYDRIGQTSENEMKPKSDNHWHNWPKALIVKNIHPWPLVKQAAG